MKSREVIALFARETRAPAVNKRKVYGDMEISRFECPSRSPVYTLTGRKTTFDRIEQR